jgi:hypothetical protein
MTPQSTVLLEMLIFVHLVKKLSEDDSLLGYRALMIEVPVVCTSEMLLDFETK